MRVPKNALKVKIFAGLSTTPRIDPANELADATDIRFTTFFPHGRYGPASFFIPRADPTKKWFFRGGDRAIIDNGQKTVWEGRIGNAQIAAHRELSGLRVTGNGQWGDNLGRQHINKPWSDNRLSEWLYEASDQFTKFDILRRADTLVAVTKDEAYINGDQIPLGRYFAPAGETVKRITFDYDFAQEGRWTPSAAKHNDDPAGADTYTDLDNTLDEDNTTFSAVTITSDDYLYIGTTKPRWEQQYLNVDMGSVVNANAATLSAEYSTEAGTWTSQSITDGTASGGATFAQDGLITFTPAKDWGKDSVNGRTMYWLRFSASADLTASIRFVAFEFVFNQSFKLAVYNNTSAADDWSVTSTASGSVDETLATPDSSPSFYFQSTGNQQGFGNGSVYGEVSNIVVYTETGTISVSNVVEDIHGLANDLNADTGHLDSNSLSIEPFITNDYETLAAILERIAAFGDSSQNSWDIYLKESEEAATPDGQPVLAMEQYPALTDHDYALRFEEDNIDSDIDIVLDYDNIANYIIVAYREAETQDRDFITPDDEATLKDTTSVSDYGERRSVVDAGETTYTAALAYGQSYLAAYKDPDFYVAGPITVKSYIRGANNEEIAAANIQAGKRLRLENFMHDLLPDSDTGLLALITETDYNDSGETNRISLGLQDDASLFLARTGAGTTSRSAGGAAVSVTAAYWYNVVSYGAKGDASTDDTSAIQAAIAAANTNGGGVVYIPSNRTFLVSGLLTLNDNIQVVGDGPNSIIKRTDGNPIIAAGSGVSNVRVANLMLEGPGAASAGSNDYGIRIKTSNNVIIERVWAHGWRAGISFYGTTTGDGNVNITIRDCYCYDNLLHGIFCIIDQDRILVENNYCYHNGGYGIVLDDSSSGTAIQAPKLCVVRGNVCRDNTGGGIILEGGRETVVSENQCFNNGTNQYYSQTQVGHGIFLSNAQNDTPCLRNVVSNNICYLNRINGIYIAGGSENIVHDNFLEDNGNGSSAGRGITISDIAGPIVSNRNKVHDNFIRKASAVDMVIGIRIDDTNCSYNEIYNNTIYDTDGTGGWTAISDLGTDTRLGFNEGDDPAALSFTDTDTTPSVIARRKAYRFVNTGATDVTDLDDALELQEVIVFSTNANTTLKDVSTTGNFHLAGSADYNIPAQGWVKLVYWGSAWREISRSAN